jgi:hypothetical protein
MENRSRSHLETSETREITFRFRISRRYADTWIRHNDGAIHIPDWFYRDLHHLIDEFKGVKAEVFPMGNDTFFEREDIGWVTFVRDQPRRLTGFVYHFPDGQEATGKKIK